MTASGKKELQRIAFHLSHIHDLISGAAHGIEPQEYAELESEVENSFMQDSLTVEQQAVLTLLVDQIHRLYYSPRASRKEETE